MDEKNNKGGELYKNVTISVKVLDVFIIAGLTALVIVTAAALILS